MTHNTSGPLPTLTVTDMPVIGAPMIDIKEDPALYSYALLVRIDKQIQIMDRKIDIIDVKLNALARHRLQVWYRRLYRWITSLFMDNDE